MFGNKLRAICVLLAITWIGCTPRLINNIGSLRENGVCDSMASPFGNGAGTSTQPYLICSAAQLQAISSGDLTANYRLMQNLDLSGITFSSIGESGNSFTGSFDGNAHTISNLSPVALFGSVGNGGLVTNFSLANVSIPLSNNTGTVANELIDGTLSHIAVTGTRPVTVNSSFANVGGVLGTGQDVTLSDISLAMDISCSSASFPHSHCDTSGGLAGTVTGNSTISRISVASHLYFGQLSLANRFSFTELNGGIIGLVTGTSLVVNQVSFVGKINDRACGGVIGSTSAASTTINQAIVVTTYGGTTDTTEMSFGGILEVVQGGGDATISNSAVFATSTLTPPLPHHDIEGWYGGIIGIVYSAGNVEINNSLSASTLPTGPFIPYSGQTGGLVGAISGGSATSNNSYYDNTILSGTVDPSGATGLSTAAMQSTSTFTGWGWSTDLWNPPVNGTSYPTLK